MKRKPKHDKTNAEISEAIKDARKIWEYEGAMIDAITDKGERAFVDVYIAACACFLLLTKMLALLPEKDLVSFLDEQMDPDKVRILVGGIRENGQAPTPVTRQ